MKGSLARRIFRTVLAIGVINVIVTLVATEFIYEDMEETNLYMGLAEERAFFESRIDAARTYSWNSALLTVFFVPEGAVGDVRLPEVFQGYPIPYFDEEDPGSKSYLISIDRTVDPPGVLYLAQDITLLEDREDTLQDTGVTVFVLGMLLLSYLLARLGTGRVVRPLRNLSRQIGEIKPERAIKHLDTDYADQELEDITKVLNRLLEALDAYVQREKRLVSMASHELRTPIAVIAGALDVIEQRNSLDSANSLTMERVRQATDKMQADVDALLKLAHRSPTGGGVTNKIDLDASIRSVVRELENSVPQHVGRVSYNANTLLDGTLQADPSLVHMLLRNLIQNALRHTSGPVVVSLTASKLSVSDAGTGLPVHIVESLESKGQTEAISEGGLGLFIVGLICERLGWRLSVRRSGPTGTVFDLAFGGNMPDSDDRQPTNTIL
ncbi:MAG: HAMP domain-containing sensor histidine kinase [Marinobacter sp.]|uniref:sensor histidine kinase n=1 Tax=Marinobacter sp. TaxID=50741 RepID=UPI0034A086E3